MSLQKPAWGGGCEQPLLGDTLPSGCGRFGRFPVCPTAGMNCIPSQTEGQSSVTVASSSYSSRGKQQVGELNYSQDCRDGGIGCIRFHENS